MPEEPGAPRQFRPFAAFLADQRQGHAAAEASEGLNSLIEAVVEHGKAGTLSLVIKVRPAGSGHHTVFVTDEVKLNLPTGDREQALFFVDDDCNLCREDPRQMSFEALRSVPDPETGEIREIRESHIGGGPVA